MLKRNIALLIAGGLLGAQVGLAAADQGTFPSNDTEVIWKLLPAQLKYLEQREADIKKEPVVPSGLMRARGVAGQGINVGPWPPISLQPRVMTKYLYETVPARIEAETRGEQQYNTIKIGAATKNVTVEHFGTVKIVNDKGQSFVWTFDTLGEVVVPLKAIAPAGFEAGDTTIYVRHPAAHIPG